MCVSLPCEDNARRALY